MWVDNKMFDNNFLRYVITTKYVYTWLQANYYVHYMFWLDIQLSFNQSTYRQYEHKGTVCVTLVLNNPATFDITVKITIDVNSTAVGKLCS